MYLCMYVFIFKNTAWFASIINPCFRGSHQGLNRRETRYRHLLWRSLPPTATWGQHFTMVITAGSTRARRMLLKGQILKCQGDLVFWKTTATLRHTQASRMCSSPRSCLWQSPPQDDPSGIFILALSSGLRGVRLLPTKAYAPGPGLILVLQPMALEKRGLTLTHLICPTAAPRVPLGPC